MNFPDFTKPTLIEPGVKYFLNETLKQCRIFKKTYNNILLNIILASGFFILLGAILLYKYKGKLSPVEKDIKTQEKRQYVLSKIKNYQQAKQIAQQELITGLPHWETDYDVFRKK